MPETASQPSREDPQESMFQKSFDKDCQHNIEMGFAELIRGMTDYGRQNATDVMYENYMVGQTISTIEMVLQWCKQLYYKYHEDVEKRKKEDPPDYVQPKKPGYAQLIAFEESIIISPTIDIANTIHWLKIIQENEIKDIAVKHKLMDRTQEKQPWEREVKERFFLNEVPIKEWEQHENYLESIQTDWKKEVFLETAYMVLKNGDIVKLISGINNSGKTWTSIPQARQANYYLRKYWATQSLLGLKDSNGKSIECLTQRTLDDLAKVKHFSMRRDVSYYPDPEAIRAKIAEGTRFNVVPITEGMKAAINLRSWDAKVIDMILEIFTERASNNYMSFEYQLTKRPPKMLQSRFNVWQHKPSQKWIVMSMPSSVYRTEDPLLTKEIEKKRGDPAVSHWFTHKSGNYNFIAKMKAPKMKESIDLLFKKYRKLAKEEYEKGKEVKARLGNVWYEKIAEYHKDVKNGHIAYLNIPDLLRARGFNDNQIAKFMRDFDKYDRVMKLSAPDRPKAEEEAME